MKRLRVSICLLAAGLMAGCTAEPCDLGNHIANGPMALKAKPAAPRHIVVLDTAWFGIDPHPPQEARSADEAREKWLGEYRAALDSAKFELLAAHPDLEVYVENWLSPFPYLLVRGDADDLKSLAEWPEVDRVMADFALRASTGSSLPFLGVEAQPDQYDAAERNAERTAGAGTIVAVIDGAVGTPEALPSFGRRAEILVLNAEDGTEIPPRIVREGRPIDFARCAESFPGETHCEDGYWAQAERSPHGTSVASIVAAVAPGARIWSLNVFVWLGDDPADPNDGDEQGASASMADVLAALAAVMEAGDARAVNLSLGRFDEPGGYCPDARDDGRPIEAMRDAWNAGITVVAASGNNAADAAVGWPACDPHVIAVGSVHDTEAVGERVTLGLPGGECIDEAVEAGQITCQANMAPAVDVVAPGVDVGFGRYSGTSQAAPHVSGHVAWLQQQAQAGAFGTPRLLTPYEVRQQIRRRARNLDVPRAGATHRSMTLDEAAWFTPEQSVALKESPADGEFSADTPFRATARIAGGLDSRVERLWLDLTIDHDDMRQVAVTVTAPSGESLRTAGLTGRDFNSIIGLQVSSDFAEAFAGEWADGPWTVEVSTDGAPGRVFFATLHADVVHDPNFARPRVRAVPNPAAVEGCIDEGGAGFPPLTDVRLVFADPVAGVTSHENVVRTDAEGRFEWSFGLGCPTQDAIDRATAYLDRVDPGRVGFVDRPVRYHAEWWGSGQLLETDVVDLALSYGGACVPRCDGRTCGVDGCGGSCGVCPGTARCDDGGQCVEPGVPGLRVSGVLADERVWQLADSPVLVTAQLTVTGSLTIEPGVVVMLADNRTDLVVADGGRLIAEGQPGSPIVFTSDGERVAEAWGGLYIAGGVEVVRVRHAEFRYGGSDALNAAQFPIAVNPRARPTLSDIVFHRNRRNGIGLVTGDYNVDAWLDTVGVPYVIAGDVILNAGVTLTIAPGAIVKFEGTTTDLGVNGRLVANGTDQRPITFTSLADDVGGDTGNDGHTAVGAGQWGGIYLAHSDMEPSILRNVAIRFGGRESNRSYDYPIRVYGGISPVIESTTLDGNRRNAIGLNTGDYGVDVHLGVVGLPYWIDADVRMNPGTVMRIDPGVVVKFGSSTDDLRIDGQLVAQGTPERRIIFTTGRDDAYGGDSNNDGQTPPVRGSWGGIHFNFTEGQPPSILEHATVLYGGYDSSNSTRAPLLVDGRTQPQIIDCQLRGNRINGLRLEADAYPADLRLNVVGIPYWVRGDVTVNPGVTMTVDPGVVVKFESSTDDLHINGQLVAEGTAEAPIFFTAGRDDAVGGDANGDGASAAGRESWGGIHLNHSPMASRLRHVEVRYGGNSSANAVSAPIVIDARTRHALDAVRLRGNRVDALAIETAEYGSDTWLDDFGLPWWIESDVTVEPGTTMTVAPGVVVKFQSSTDDLWVRGRLVAEGTPVRPIYFTSGRDDSLLGDSNANGASAGRAGLWGGIGLSHDPATPGSSLRHVVFRHGGYDSVRAMRFPLLFDPTGGHALSALTFVRNRINGAAINPGDYERGAQLTDIGAAYWIESDVLIRGTLRLEPGTVLKFRDTNDDLHVHGRLLAEGTAERPVVFTSSEDDSRRGDTNGDGASAAEEGDWGGIFLSDTSLGNRLRHAVVAYGGSDDDDSLDCGLVIESPDVSIEHSTFSANDSAVCVWRAGAVDLGGGPHASPGGNHFGPGHGPGDWAVYNLTPRDIYAYGNTWTAVGAAIEDMLYDRTDDLGVGEVLFDRLPVAEALQVSTAEDSPLPIRLGGLDPEGAPLSHRIDLRPLHGALAGEPPAVVYTPDPDFHGADRFTYTVWDGIGRSRPAEVSITVLPVDDAPRAFAAEYALDEDGEVAFDLAGVDVDGDRIDFVVTRGAERGALIGESPDLIYRPEPDTFGEDAITFVAQAAQAESAPATVRFVIRPVNDAPVATSTALGTDEDTPVEFVLGGRDVDGDPLTARVVDGPAVGMLAGEPPRLTYTPPPDWSGRVTVGFVVHDGQVDSARGQVEIEVRPVADAPVADALEVETQEDIPLAIGLSSSDVDDEALAYSIVRPPEHGRLEGAPPALVYHPDDDRHGVDGFRFAVEDPTGRRDEAEVVIRVAAVDDPPRALDDAVDTREDVPVALRLGGEDVDGDPLTWQVVEPPAAGRLEGEAPDLTYHPPTDESGQWTLRFTVSDGTSVSAPATVTLRVSPVEDAPRIEPVSDQTHAEGDVVELQMVGHDPEGLALAWRAIDLPPGLLLDPETGLLSGRLSFESAGDWSPRVTASDPTGALTEIAWAWRVHPTNRPPVLSALDGLEGEEGRPVILRAGADDPDGDPLNYVWRLGDGSPPVAGAGLGEVQHSFADDGVYRVEVEVSDGVVQVVESAEVTVHNVPPRFIGDPPLFVAGDASFDYLPRVEDPGTDPIVLRLLTAPEGARVDGGGVSWAPSDAQRLVAPHVFELEADDGDGGRATQRWSVEVAFTDDDGDGVPDACERQFGLDPADPADGDEDADLDGISNRDECLAGADPTRFDGPSAPAIDDPPLGARLASTRPALRVANANDPDGDHLTYTFEVYAEPDLRGAPLAVSPAVDEGPQTTSWTPPALPDDARVWWRARARDAHAYGPWSDVGWALIDTENAPPPTPEPMSPVGRVAQGRPLLQARPVVDPEGDEVIYLFEIHRDPALEQQVDGGVHEQPEWTSDIALGEDAVYWWRVAARDALGAASAWSEPVRIRIDAENSAPGAPEIISPAPDEQVSAVPVEVHWMPPVDLDGDVLSHRLSVFEVAAPERAVFEADIAPFDVPPPFAISLEGLEEDRRYRVELWAIDREGPGPTATVTFTVNALETPPDAPRLIAPVDEVDVPAGPVEFIFETATDPDGDPVEHLLEVYPAEGGAPIWQVDFDSSATGRQAEIWAEAMPGSRYRWTVIATDDTGLSSVDPEVWRFGVARLANRPPDAPTPISPTGDLRIEPDPVTLRILDAHDPDGDELLYTFELFREVELQDRIWSAEAVPPGQEGETSVRTAALDAYRGERLFWRAFATDSEGARGPSSEVARFIVAGEPDAGPKPDAGPEPDAEPLDVDLPDLGVTDAALPESIDVGADPADASRPSVDLGLVPDAEHDMSPRGDAAVAPVEPPAGGCACDSVGSRPDRALLLLVVLLGLRRRQRQGA